MKLGRLQLGQRDSCGNPDQDAWVVQTTCLLEAVARTL